MHKQTHTPAVKKTNNNSDCFSNVAVVKVNDEYTF